MGWLCIMDYFCTNLRVLRKISNETQSDLGSILNLTQHAISQYETGKNSPDADTLERIANHYGVSLEMLKSVDLSNTLHSVEFTISKSGIASLKNLFPLIISEEAMSNKLFADAVKQHESFLCSLFNEEKIPNYSFLDVYDKLADEGLIEATANAISCILLLYFLCYVMKITENAKTSKENIGYEVQIPFDLTCNYLRIALSPNLIPDRSNFIKLIRERYMVYIQKLKCSGTYADLGDYFVALLFLFNLADEDLSAEDTMMIFVELLSLGKRLGNAYIIQLNNMLETDED